MKRGFTLIELLAVIVILAIIALIAVPIVINIINDSKNSSEKESVKLYMKAAQTSIAKENLKNKYDPSVCNISQNGNLKCFKNDEELEEIVVDVSGNKPTSGTIYFENGKITEANNILFSDKKYNYKNNEVLEVIKKSKTMNINIDNNVNSISVYENEDVDFIVTSEGLSYKSRSESNYKKIWSYTGNNTFLGLGMYPACNSKFSITSDTSELSLIPITKNIDLEVNSRYDRLFIVNINSFNEKYKIDLNNIDLNWYDSSNNLLGSGFYYSNENEQPLGYNISYAKKEAYIKDGCSGYGINIILFEGPNN